MDSGEAEKTLTMVEHFLKQITELEASREDKQAELSGSLAAMNLCERPLTPLRGLREIIQI